MEHKRRIVRRFYFISATATLLACVAVLILARIPIDTELAINVRADFLSFDQLDDFEWFGNSIEGKWLGLKEETTFRIRTYKVEIRKNGRTCFGSDDVENLEIRPMQNDRSKFFATLSKTSALGENSEKIKLNKIIAPKGSRVSLFLMRNPNITIILGIENGTMKGELYTEKFYLEVENGEAKVEGKNKLCNGSLTISGESSIATPLEFETKSRITVDEPQSEDEYVFIYEIYKKNSINNIHVRILSEIDTQRNTRKSYIKYYAVKSDRPAKTRDLLEGEETFISSRNYFDINVLRVSPSGIDFVSRTRSKKVRIDNRSVSPNLLENFPRPWILIGGILFFFLKDIFLSRILKE